VPHAHMHPLTFTVEELQNGFLIRFTRAGTGLPQAFCHSTSEELMSHISAILADPDDPTAGASSHTPTELLWSDMPRDALVPTTKVNPKLPVVSTTRGRNNCGQTETTLGVYTKHKNRDPDESYKPEDLKPVPRK
jgi:hypothetical protein